MSVILASRLSSSDAADLRGQEHCLSASAEGRDIKLRFQNLSKAYGTTIAVSDANLEVREGEFITLLGPSGSGKTTLLMMAAGLIAPTAGDIWIDKALSTYAPPQQRGIGVVFQNYALFPHLTVFENVAFPLRMRKKSSSDIARDVKRVLEIVQLEHLADRLPATLSGGQQQRVAFARCTVYRPSIILMDEPLGALDRKLRDQMQSEMKYLHKQLGITLLHITHDQDEAMAMSDRIGVMNQGRIEQVGGPYELYSKPKSLFVADFLGESNIFESEIVAIADEVCLRGPGETIIKAAVAGDWKQGANVKVMVRPENMELLRSGDSKANMLAGIVTDKSFVSGVRRCGIKVSGDVHVLIKAFKPVAGVSCDLGDAVRIGWDSDQTVILPA